MSIGKSRRPTAALIEAEHQLVCARAAEEALPHYSLPRGGVLSVEYWRSAPVVVFREWLVTSPYTWDVLTAEQQRALYLAILSTPLGRLVSVSPLIAWIPVKDISPKIFSSLLRALTTPKDAATLSRLLRSIAYDDACLGS